MCACVCLLQDRVEAGGKAPRTSQWGQKQKLLCSALGVVHSVSRLHACAQLIPLLTCPALYSLSYMQVGGLLIGGFTSGVGATMPVSISNCAFVNNTPVQPADTLTLQGGGVCIQVCTHVGGCREVVCVCGLCMSWVDSRQLDSNVA